MNGQSLIRWLFRRSGWNSLRERIVLEEQAATETELNFVEKINLQRKAGWIIDKRKDKRGKTKYMIKSN